MTKNDRKRPHAGTRQEHLPFLCTTKVHRKGKTLAVWIQLPMVEESPSVCASSKMKWNFDDFFQEIGPLQKDAMEANLV